MTDDIKGSAVITTDQIYAELQHVSRVLVELKIRFEALGVLEKHIEKLERLVSAQSKTNWKMLVAWSAAASGAFATVYQTWAPH